MAIMSEIDTSNHVWKLAGKCANDQSIRYTRLDIFYDKHFIQEAKRYCSDCPIQIECYQYAMSHPIEQGVWGGVSARERNRQRKKLVIDLRKFQERWAVQGLDKIFPNAS